MTKIEVIDNLKKRIKEYPIDPPHGLTANELKQWFEGYYICQCTILDLINEMEGVR